ncbi:MAG: type III-A CRISPR-associated RAMP protein Csm3 [Thermoplasmata archaeon]
MKLKGRIKVNAVLTVETGLHIGGMKETYRIGDVDNPVIKIKWKRNNEMKDLPYIPGSSLKGKIRSLVEEKEKNNGDFCKCGSCTICKLFGPGPTGEAKGGKPRLKVRDGFLCEDQEAMLESVEFVEIKMENTIDRARGTAKNPRQTERVLPGTKFDVEFVISLYEGDQPKEFLELLFGGLYMLEDDYLGGSGSRGYGKISFSSINIYYTAAEDYKAEKAAKKVGEGKTLKEVNISEICSQIK